MPKDFNQISAPAPKDKQMAAVGIALERLLHEQGQAVAASGAAGRHTGPGVKGVAGRPSATMAGTNLGSSSSAVRRPWLSKRRQVNNWLGVKPCRRAVADTIRGAR